MNEYQDQSVWWRVEERLGDGRWVYVEDHDDRVTAEARRDCLSEILSGSVRVRRVSGLSV